MLSRKKIILAIIAILTTGIAILFITSLPEETVIEENTEAKDTLVVKDTIKKYGLPIEEFAVKYDTVRSRQTLAEILMNLGFSSRETYELSQCPDSIFNVRKIRAGNAYALLSSRDSTHRPLYFIYEDGAKEYVKY